MQTKQQIQQLLASVGASPNKRLGQNFLIDLNLMRLLIDSADINSDDIVLEVGCGTGSLTEEIAQHAGKVIAIEFDSTLAKIAKRQLAEKNNVEIINTDILENKNSIDAGVVASLDTARKQTCGRFLLISNLPYNVASPVMLNLIAGPIKADAMYVTVQKEVAQRMMAKPGNKNYGTLSIFLAATGSVSILRILKPTVFWPQPQVDSAMISFIPTKEKLNRIHNFELLREVVHLFMQHRRKMLNACTKFAKDNLKQIDDWSTIFKDSCVAPDARPETLWPKEYVAIANLCNEHLHGR